MNKITRNTTLEELVEIKDDAISYLFQKNIRCVLCGEPVMDTIENAARKKGYSDSDIDILVEELNALK